MRDEALLMGELQNVGGIGGLAAELARQRPLGTGAVADDAADHPAAGGGARDFLRLGLAIDGKESDAEPKGRCDFRLLLDRVAVGDPLRRRARREHGPNLAHRGDVEAAAEPGQQFEDFRRRVGLDGIEHLGVRQHLGEVEIVVADHVKIDDEAGSVFGALLEKFADSRGHCHPLPYPTGGDAAEVNLLRRARLRTVRSH